MKLHLGSGKRYIPGFVHVDINYSPHVDYQHDIRNLPMVRSNTVDLIYCCHGIEYFDRIEIVEVLREWKRVLKKGGILRLAMPDFEALVKAYRKYKDLDKIIGPLYGRWEIKRRNGEKDILYHKAVYDLQSVKKLLESQGFVNVKRYDWRKTIHKDYDDYSQSYIPHMDKEHGMLISLNIEAVKS